MLFVPIYLTKRRLFMAMHRLFVRKRSEFAYEADQVLRTLREDLSIPAQSVTLYKRYDIEGLDDKDLGQAKELIFSEPPVDQVFTDLPHEEGAFVFAVEYLPGQYDQGADSAEQCLSMLTLKQGYQVRIAQVFSIQGPLTEDQKKAIKAYFINPVDSRQATMTLPTSLQLDLEEPQAIPLIDGFTHWNQDQLDAFIKEEGLAMTLSDALLIQDYFKDQEGRNPSQTEIKVLDTYWSDHCRHTTFMTELTQVTIDKGRFNSPIEQAYQAYQEGRKKIYTSKTKASSLMDMATLATKELKTQGLLSNLDESDEINACTIIVPVDVDGREEEWLLLFKNETHNHPTEIEPFGGAATCLGGCIRDPLSGRAYVYQAMRITGAGDPRTSLDQTLAGKLPQRRITQGAAKGYSSYGNQIGLATGEVKEYYHPGYVAKRMEIGAVVGAVPRAHVRREAPKPGDVVMLIGGKTGRDGCGGATGSSKEHTMESLSSCGAEVQKGNPLTERKIQRLFRQPEVTQLIKRCNDFGAGGVSVAIGELTDGLDINLDLVPKKYAGLDGTELAISESQERMACVIEKNKADLFKSYCDQENLECTQVALVTDTNRLVMHWKGSPIVDISRDFLNTNGAKQEQAVHIGLPQGPSYFAKKEAPVTDFKGQWLSTLSDLNVGSQEGLLSCFDSTVGGGTVLMPLSGKYQKTPVQGMAAKLPVRCGQTNTASVMTHGFNPDLASWSPFHGAQFAILLSVAKGVTMGAHRQDMYLTLQEYFESLRQNPHAWGKPTAALLGAYQAQKELNIAAIGGKDSMSGTFIDLTAPPSLVSFAVATAPVDRIISPDLKGASHRLILLKLPRTFDEAPDWRAFKANCDLLQKEIDEGRVYSAYTIDEGGLAEAITKMALGNRIGVKIDDYAGTSLFDTNLGSFLFEVDITAVNHLLEKEGTQVIGVTQEEPVIQWKDQVISLDQAQAAYEGTLQHIFPLEAPSTKETCPLPLYEQTSTPIVGPKSLEGAKPKVLIPVFPGTNCEYDSARAFERAGAQTDILVIRNQSIANLEESIQAIKSKLEASQIIFFPGGFSAGDEPDGSGKFMATLFRNPYLAEALEDLLYQRDGLALGICNGFQALIKLGLLPGGHVSPLREDSPTLTHNPIGRHLSGMVNTKVISTMSPWMSALKAGDIFTIPISHGEGRFVASPDQVARLAQNGQIATQYVDFQGQATMDARFNPNQSVCAIEGIFSPDGRVFGKMAHSERCGHGISKNVPGNHHMPILESGVIYFK